MKRFIILAFFSLSTITIAQTNCNLLNSSDLRKICAQNNEIISLLNGAKKHNTNEGWKCEVTTFLYGGYSTKTLIAYGSTLGEATQNAINACKDNTFTDYIHRCSGDVRNCKQLK